LLCRDADSFVKAFAVSVAFEKDTRSEEWWVRLLTPAERSKNMKIVSETLKSKKMKTAIGTRRSSAKYRRSSASNTRSRTPTRFHKRSHTPKRSKKDRADAKDKSSEEFRHHTQHHGPISQVVCFLADHVIRGQVLMMQNDLESENTLNLPIDDFDYKTKRKHQK
jgi:hypothetical protein